MGIHISLMRKSTGSEVSHDEWDFGRVGGDREFAALDLPIIETSFNGYSGLYRPSDFTIWRDAIRDPPFFERHQQLLDKLEADDDLWIWVG